MILTVDIGNTRTKTAFFEKDDIAGQAFWESWTLKDLLALWQEQNVKGVIISASGKVPVDIVDFLQQKKKEGLPVIFLSEETPIPIQNSYATPESLGKDRLAAVTGAAALFPGENALVIDTGTCYTYNILSKEGIFLGGNITPGMELQYKAMHSFTAKLPLVERGESDLVLGNTTETAIRSGVQWGTVFTMVGFIRHYTKTYDNLHVILTGGDAFFLNRYLPIPVKVAPDLVLYGLNKIFKHNFQNKN